MSGAGRPAPSRRRARPLARVRPLAWLPGLVVLAGLVWVVTRHVDEERELWRLLSHANPVWLALAGLLQIATYLTVGETWRIPLAAAGLRIRRARLAALVLLKLTVDQAVPTGGVSGALFMIRRLHRRGVPSDVLGATLLIVLGGYFLAYAVAVVGALVVLWLERRLVAAIVLPAAVFVLVAATLPLVAAWGARRWRPPAWLRRRPWARELLAQSRVASPRLVGRAGLYAGSTAGSLLTMVLDALTLAATLFAVGASPHLLDCFAALVVASLAATIGITPGGLGTFEAGSVGVLTLTGTSAARALGGTLLLRGFTFWLPMLPGLVIMSREGRRRRTHAA